MRERGFKADIGLEEDGVLDIEFDCDGGEGERNYKKWDNGTWKKRACSFPIGC